ncbi:DUF4855 domain-containing protein [Sporosarcina thermotolerans]|uniref:DUF4855 domain-containing protein n=1 Tax=Sporosarcina thermotolerans TaxID=633404 RepID=A0AAW9A8L2_9BACL|nr:DUF4855 domain-containing protein [Sporosarcina thermotolerans]MDW0116083.1 DUF4855 domain-containing protein [Sporosarcina thermotolerans]
MKPLKLFTAFILSFFLLANTAAAQSFQDVPTDHWAHDEIRFLTDKQVIRGFSDGSFKPLTVLTRKDAAVMLVRALKLPTIQQPQVKPADLKPTMGGYSEMMIAANKGFFTVTGNRFNPNQPLTRDEMAKALAVAYGYNGKGTSFFKDVAKGNPYYKFIDGIAENGITTGYSDGTFKPTVAVNRAQFSTFLKRVYDKPHEYSVKKDGRILKTFTDETAAISYAVSQAGSTVHPVSNSLMKYEQRPVNLKATGIKNGVLIYSGSEKEAFDKDFYAPYLAKGDSTFFDTFIVMGRQYPNGEFQETPKNLANYSDWKWFADKLFSPSGPLRPLNEAAVEANRKAKVYIGIPYPKRNGNLIDLNGKKLPNTLDNRKQMVNWYISTVEQQWKRAGLTNLTLTGYYWVNETVIHADDELLVTDTAAAIHKLNKKFIYAPHARTTNFGNWKYYGFDGAYLQPNTFRLNLGDPKAKLHKAFLEAQIKGSSITLEIDTYSPHQIGAGLPNFETYLEFAKRYDLQGFLLYQGTEMVYRMGTMKNDAYQKAYEELWDFME